MIRLIEKRNYRSKVEACWDISEQTENCVKNSENFAKLNNYTKNIVHYVIGKKYLGDYIRMWANPSIQSNKGASLFFNEESDMWTKENANTESLKLLKEECNLFALHECCKATYNLDSLEGNYENIGQKFKKN
jgi:hypothetical protein